jgi:exodeoxyribonuclease VII small subunit
MKKNTETLSYEKAVERLENIVAELEGGTLELDLLAEHLKEAKELLAFCRTKLTQVETDVQKILEDGKE